MNRNRNWYTAPSQGSGRSAHDYGRSGPIQSAEDRMIARWDFMLAAVVVFGFVVWVLV